MTRDFWETNPALLAGISLCFGIGVSLFGFPLWFLIAWVSYVAFLRKWACLVLVVLGGAYALAICQTPPIETPIRCSARFSISSLQRHQTPFHHNYLYRGTLYWQGFTLPCSIAVRHATSRPAASCDYLIDGTLFKRGAFDYVLKPTHWTPVARSWSLAEMRFWAKENIRSLLRAKLRSHYTAELLSSLATGEVENRQLRYEFGRLGLQHLLAISGFHFGVLLLFLSLFLSLFLRARSKWIAMLLCLTLYFLFLGASPAVQRAFLSASLFLLGKLLRRRASPLNILGAAMLIELLLNPLSAANIGFQLSFASCFGILLLHRPIETLLRQLWPVRPFQEAARLPIPSQCAYLLSTALRSTISLTLAVNTTILPLLLFHFGKFPYLSFLYNLFIPLLVSLALFGLLASLTTYLAFGAWSEPLFSSLDWFCNEILELISHPPLRLDHSLYAPEFPAWVPALWLCGVFVVRMWWEVTQRTRARFGQAFLR